MPENNTNNQVTDSQPPPIDLQSISQVVVNLHIARRTLLIYPATHEQVKLSIKRAHGRLSLALDNEGQLSLTVMKNGLGVGGRRLQTKNPVFKDLAGVLKHYQIAMVTFHKALEIKELARFLQLITVDREKVAARGGIEAVVQKQKLPHIRIKAVDYSKLQLTEEQEIQRSDSQGREDGSIWQQFVTHMAIADANAEADEPALDPILVAKMLNTRQMDVGQAIGHYQSIFEQAAGQTVDQQPLSDGLIKFQEMIKGLNADLQNQFLSTTFKNCAKQATISDTANLIDGLGGELILRMLAQANDAGEKISPSLLAFVQKMGQIDVPLKSGSAMGQPTDGRSEELTDENVASLLAPEQHETYVDEGYAQLLNNLTAQASQEAAALSFNEEVDAALTDSQVNVHTGRAITRLMTSSLNTAGYRDWARQLTYLLDDLLKSRSFAYLAELMVLLRHEQHDNDDDRAQIAELVMDRFGDPQFVADAVQKARRPDGDMASDALSFLIELGESVAAEVLEELDPAETFSGHTFYEKLLDDLGAVTAKEALARIKDPRPEYVQRMIRIIRRVGDADMVEQLKPMLEHADIEVRMEALASLLKFGNNWGLIWLRERLHEPWSDEVYRAMELAGRYRVRDVVPELIEYVERHGEMARREAALRALCRIGDPSAIASLTKLAHRRWSLAKKQTRHLKRVLYENLGGYAYADIKSLLHWGMKQKDPSIRSVCERLFKTARRGTEPGGKEDNSV